LAACFLRAARFSFLRSSLSLMFFVFIASIFRQMMFKLFPARQSAPPFFSGRSLES
jgi:hypothetical protein